MAGSRIKDECGLHIARTAETTRERMLQEAEVFDYLTSEDPADDTMWDHAEYLTTASDRGERRLKLERDAVGRLMDRAERRKRRRDRVIWLVAGLVCLTAVALVLWKLGRL